MIGALKKKFAEANANYNRLVRLHVFKRDFENAFTEAQANLLMKLAESTVNVIQDIQRGTPSGVVIRDYLYLHERSVCGLLKSFDDTPLFKEYGAPSTCQTREIVGGIADVWELWPGIFTARRGEHALSRTFPIDGAFGTWHSNRHVWWQGEHLEKRLEMMRFVHTTLTNLYMFYGVAQPAPSRLREVRKVFFGS